MDQLFFSISFVFEILPSSLSVRLCAEIESRDGKNFIVRSISREGANERSLLPVFSLSFSGGKWLHGENGRESRIGNTIGEAIDVFLSRVAAERDEIEERKGEI